MRGRAAAATAASLALVATVISAGPAARAAPPTVISVPAQVPTIQGAIEAASAGDTIVVAPGLYNENLDFKGKAIEVRSSAGPAATVVDGRERGSVVRFASGEGRQSVIRGFTLRNGKAEMGGGVLASKSSPTIAGNRITRNVAWLSGAGVATDASPLITGNHIDHNGRCCWSGGSGGGGVWLGGDITAEAEVIGNRIVDNPWSGGGGIEVFGAGSVLIKDNVVMFNGNWGGSAGGIRLANHHAPRVIQNVVAHNRYAQVEWTGAKPGPLLANNTIVSGPDGAGVFVTGFDIGGTFVNNLVRGSLLCTWYDGPPPTPQQLSHNNVWNGGNEAYGGCGDVEAGGNVSADPNFAPLSPATLPYRVVAPSPVVDAGDPSVADLVPTDLGGRPRTGGTDIGAYEAGAAGSSAAAWGWNVLGQVGDGTTIDRAEPVVVAAPGSAAVSVAAGGYHNLARRGDGTVVAWGWNGAGQLGDGTTIDRSAPVVVPGLSNVVSVAAGTFVSLALKADGTVWAWGWNGTGQVGDGTTTDRHVPTKVTGLSGVTAISAGGYHALARKGDGSVWAWGWNGLGQLGDGTTTDRYVPTRVNGLAGVSVTSISAGALHSLASDSKGRAWGWGWNGLGQLGDGTDATRLSATWISGPAGVMEVAAGGYHSLARTTDGSLLAWGWNGLGQLGDSTTFDRWNPVTIPDIQVRAIGAGGFHSVAESKYGEVLAWGWNGVGQLGDGTTETRHVPTGLGRPAGRHVAAGLAQTLAA